MSKVEIMNKVGDRVFLNPAPLYSNEELARNSLASNTYRGFHRINKKNPNGPSLIFRRVLIQEKDYIIQAIKKATTEKCLDDLSEDIHKVLLKELQFYIKGHQLKSYNKVRHPVDIVIEHMVSMCLDFEDKREVITKSLFLPLHSDVFSSEFLFSDAEAMEVGIKRNFKLKHIESKSHYMEVQCFLKEKANSIGLNNRIYFDLLWSERYKSSGTNLFHTNPVNK